MLPAESAPRKSVEDFRDVLMNGDVPINGRDYAEEFGDRLKGRVFDDIFPHISEGFVSFIRKRDGVQADLSQEALDEVFQGTLAFLYRALFLLYAEARDLLPVKEVRGYHDVNLKKIKEEVAAICGTIPDEVKQKLKENLRDDSYILYDRLMRLFQTLDKRDTALNVPFYDGGLFLSNPEKDDGRPEAASARFLNSTKLADRYLAGAIDLLARDRDRETQALAFIDYKSLGVRQLGSIYEGLQQFTLRVAPEKMAIVQGKKTEEIIPYREAVREKRKILTNGRGRNTEERVWPKGKVYLENDKRERKAAGSYYTPDHIAKYIVENAVGPVLKRKFETLRPKLRNAQAERKAFFDRQKAFAKSGMKPEPESKADFIGRELVDEFFDVKVLDPAMGSGHFLVEAVDFITDKALDFLNAFPWNPISAYLAKMRQDSMKEMEDLGVTVDAARLSDVNLLKRCILKRCIYGVDVNPMAVELAKVSLWLDCCTVGAPLVFLDHHIKCGNSLVGVTVDEVREAYEESAKADEEAFPLLGGALGRAFARLDAITRGIRKVAELSDLIMGQVKESRETFRRVCDSAAPIKRILDMYTSQWFGNPPEKTRAGKTVVIRNPAMDFLKSQDAESYQDKGLAANLTERGRQLAQKAESEAHEKRFFHWELEFPDVFLESGSRKPGAGFDAVMGNPPYDVMEKERGAAHWPHEELLNYIKAVKRYKPCLGGKLNLYRPFLAQSLDLMSQNALFSMIVPMSIMGDVSLANTRSFVIRKNLMLSIAAFPQKDDPDRRVFRDAKLSTCVPALSKQEPDPSHRFPVNTYPANRLEDEPKKCLLSLGDIETIDSGGIPIPASSQAEIELALKIHRGHPRFRDVAEITRGEINQTILRRFITSERTDTPLLKGAEIRLFGFNKTLSQGERQFFDERAFENDRKSRKPPIVRIATQRHTGVDESTRLVGALSQNGAYFADSTNSIVPKGDHDILVLLAFLNSDVLNWRFSLTSTNNNVGTNELDALPYSNSMSDEKKAMIRQLVLRLQDRGGILSSSGHWPDEFKELNRLVYEAYGLSGEEERIVRAFRQT